MKIGIVGMPNAGKSTLFNALTAAGAETGDYPFTTVEPNVAVVQVPDERLERVAETLGSSEVVHETIDFHDIAGPRQGGLAGGGARQPVPRLDPRDRRDLPRDPRPRRRVRRPSRGPDRPGRRRRADRDRAAGRRPRVRRAPARARREAGPLGRQGGRRRARLAARRWSRRSGGGPAGARGAGAGSRPGRSPQALAADRQAGPLRRQRRRGRERGAAGAARPCRAGGARRWW